MSYDSNHTTQSTQSNRRLEEFSTIHGREASAQFLSAIAHTGAIWIKASWDLPTPPPANWPLKKDGSPVNYVYTGTVNAKGFSLIPCKYAGSDENGNTIWEPTKQHYSDGFAHCLDLSHAGATIYFYPNQPQGGISNGHVVGTDLVFYEIDDLLLAQQWEALNQLRERTGLEPAAVVFTGGKSLHGYIRLTENVSPSKWQTLNRKLTVIQDSDPAICNPGRAMRLPGLVRRKLIDGQLTEPAQITLEQFSNATYTPADFEARLDSTGLFPYGLSDERWRQWQRAKRDKQDKAAILQKPESELFPKYQAKPTSHEFAYDGSTIPLEVCLSKDDRALLASGAGAGNRDNAAIKLGKNLFATFDRLHFLGFHCQDDPRQLLEEFGSRCSPALPSRDIDRIYRSATRGNPTPSLPDEIIKNCVATYLHRENATFLRTGNQGEVSREEWERKHKDQNVLASFLQRELKRCRQWFKPSEPAQAEKRIDGGLVPFGVVVTDAGERTFHCEPGDVPTPERMEWLGWPTLVYPKGARQQIIREAYEKGWWNIQDQSRTGSGKSHDLGNFSLANYPGGMNKVFYLSDDAENPTTATLEDNYTRLVTRHDGQKYDRTHQTATGRPHIRRIKPGDIADIPANCPETQTFLKFPEKGALISGGKGSPICESCPLFAAGCEFIEERRTQLDTESFLRAHPSQIPTSVKKDEKNIAIWDEPGKILQVNAPFKLDFMKLQQAAAMVQANGTPKQYALIATILNEWHEALMGVQIPLHGLSFPAVKRLLRLPRFVVDADGSIEDLDPLQLAEEIDELFSPRIDFSGIETPEQKQKWVEESWHSNYFKLIFEALYPGCDKYTNITIDKDWKFTISQRVRHHRQVAKSMELNIFLDATLSRGDLASQIGIRKIDILPICEEPADFSNLVINFVRDIGKFGQARETEGKFAQQNRLKEFIAAVSTPDKTTGVIDLKKFATPEGYGYWWLDNRGSNAYKDVDQLILVGSPTANLGAQAAKYQAIFGEAVDPTDLSGSFGAWVRRNERSEINQGVGRLRAQHSDKTKTCHILGDQHGEALERELKKAYPGCTINYVSAADICVEAAPKGIQTTRSIFSAIWEGVQAGIKVTRASIAENVGKSVERVKQLLKDAGGFAKVTRGVENLLLAIKGKLPPLELDADALYIAQNYLPDVAAALESNDGITDPVEELAAIRSAFGSKTYLGILASTPPAALATILKHIIKELPAAILERIGLDDPDFGGAMA